MKISNFKLKISQYFSSPIIIILFLLSIGAVLRFYNLNWGAPYYFHPDERNIASSISQLTLLNMHPHFFAYGSLPIYTIFLVSLPHALLTYCLQEVTVCSVRFEDALLLGRIFSAAFSTLLIPLLFIIGKRLHSTTTGLLAAFFATFSTGLLQYAHFATFEIWNTFFSTLLFFLCIRIVKQIHKTSVVVLGVLVGTLIAIKVSNAVLAPVTLLAMLLGIWTDAKKKRLRGLRITASAALHLLLFLITIALVYMVTNPYVFSDPQAFRDAMNYESTVALGTLPVFYTGEFFNTIPVLYQYVKVFPFLLNPELTILSLIAFGYMCVKTVQAKNSMYTLLLLTLLALLLPQSFFFVKWTRYMVPTLPFFYLMIAVMLSDILSSKKGKLTKTITTFLVGIVLVLSSIFGISHFMTAYVEMDTRVAASAFARKHITSTTPMLSEMYDMGIVAFNENFSAISLFNFYDLDNNSPIHNTATLNATLDQYEYLILPSQRVLATRLQNKNEFPEGYAFYEDVITNKKRFTKIYETPCSLFCKIVFLNDQVLRFEGTANDFDRPPLMIFRINHES